MKKNVKKESKAVNKKYYHVIFVDEYDNFFELGYYLDLKDAEKDANVYLSQYNLSEDDETDPGGVPKFGENENLGHLVEYPSTVSMCFDKQIYVDEGVVQVRGFIKETRDTIKQLQKLEEKR